MKGDTDKEWSEAVAGLIAADLLDAGLISAEQGDSAREIVAEKIWIRLAIGDRPETKSH